MNNNYTKNKNDLIQEPYVGMPINSMNMYKNKGSYDCGQYKSVCDSVNHCPLAMAYVPMQQWCETYEPAVGFHQGTIFPELDLPFLGGGRC